jgi:hypothetical protein
VFWSALAARAQSESPQSESPQSESPQSESPQSESPHSESTPSSANDLQASATRDAQRLQATLDSLAQPERVERQVAGWTLTGAGVLGATAATYVAIKSQDPHWLLATTDSVLVAAVGIQTLAQDGPFGYLARYARNDPAHPAGTEQEWLRAGQAQRRARRWAGAAFLVMTAGASLGGIAAALDQEGWHSNTEHYGAVSAWFGLAAISGIGGAWYLLNPSPVESALHDYERSSGHTVTDGASAAAPKFRLGAAPAGFMAEISGTF